MNRKQALYGDMTRCKSLLESYLARIPHASSAAAIKASGKRAFPQLVLQQATMHMLAEQLSLCFRVVEDEKPIALSLLADICCAGHCPCSGKMKEQECPEVCLGLEVCLCILPLK